MKRRICVRSMGLGAVIMLVGLAVGAIVSPPLIAQRDDVFGDIQCTGLTVVDKQGKRAVALSSSLIGNMVAVYNEQGPWGVALWSHVLGNNVIVNDKQGDAAVKLVNDEDLGNSVAVLNKQGNEAVALRTDEHGGIVNVSGKDSGSASMFTIANSGVVRVKGKDGGGVVMATNEHGGTVGVSGKDSKVSGRAEIKTDEHGGRFDVYNNQGKSRAAMGINEFGNGAVSTWDKNGYRQREED